MVKSDTDATELRQFTISLLTYVTRFALEMVVDTLVCVNVSLGEMVLEDYHSKVSPEPCLPIDANGW